MTPPCGGYFLRAGVLTASTDIYSLGIIMWEVYMGLAVFKELTDAEVISEVRLAYLCVWCVREKW